MSEDLFEQRVPVCKPIMELGWWDWDDELGAGGVYCGLGGNEVVVFALADGISEDVTTLSYPIVKLGPSIYSYIWA